MADYKEHFDEIWGAGAAVVAVSVDEPEKSETLRRELGLPFVILCDTERRVVKEWGIFNAEEKGGIAKTALFIVEPGGVVSYAAVDSVVKRVPAAEVVTLLKNAGEADAVRRKVQMPRFADWVRGLGNYFRV